MANEIGARLLDLLESLGLSQSQFALRLGVNQANLNQIINGKRPFGKNMQRRVISEFGVSLDWLLTGEGEMLKGSGGAPELGNEVENITPQEQAAIDRGLRDGTYRMVPLVNIDSVGGMSSLNSIDPSEQYIMKLIPFTEAREGDRAILQSGNSMAPNIPAGSALLIREVQDWREYFGYGGIFVLWLRDGRRITKEIRRYDPDPQNYVWCVSYNPDIADEELPRSMIRGVWKVIKYLADFGW